jgi:hypothetical protein
MEFLLFIAGVGVGSWLVTRQNGQTVLLYRKEF